MADPHFKPLKSSAAAWALGRALRYAIATAIAAFVIATLFSGAAAERLATAGYVAAIFAVLALAVKALLPEADESPAAARQPSFPALFSFSVGVAIFLIVAAALVAQPRSEVTAIVVCAGLVGTAALSRLGAFTSLHAVLAEGGGFVAATRYAAALAIAALCLVALLPATGGEGFARLAYAIAVAATLFFGASLVVSSLAGSLLQSGYARNATLLRTPRSASVFLQTARYAIATCILAMVLAALLHPVYAERFATVAYLAALFAALATWAVWRLRELGVEAPQTTVPQPAKFARGVGAFTLVGAAAATNPIVAALAVCVSLYLIGAAIVKQPA